MNNKKIIDKKIPKFVYISTFFIMYLSSSFSLSTYAGTNRILFMAVLAAYMLLMNFIIEGSKTITVNVPTILAVGTATCSYLINHESFHLILVMLTYYITATIFINIIDFKQWQFVYVRVLYIVALASLILYLLDLIAPDILNVLPMTSNSTGIELRTAFISIAPHNGRNMGFFWEPGAFQTYLAIAIIFELFVFQAESKKRVIVMFLAMITTFSTAGYVTFLFVVLTAVLSGTYDSTMKKSYKVAIVITIIALMFSTYIMNNVNGGLYNALIGKVENYSHNKDAYSSTGVRMSAIIDGINIFKDNPLFGAGITNFKEIFAMRYGHSMTTCTYVNWFAMYGFFYGVIMLVGTYRFVAFLTDKRFIRVMLFISMLLAITSEDYVLNPSILILTLYGFSYKTHFVEG